MEETNRPLTVTGLRKQFGETVAVANFGVDIAPGEIVGLLGPNGAGKTTTISCIAGLLVPDEGEVHICGHLAVRGRDARRVDGRRARGHMGVSTQRLAVYPALDVVSNLRFYAVLSGVPTTEVEARVGETAKLFELRSVLDKRVQHLSVGQQRLVHVATSFVGRPRLLLLDEPTAGLDVMARGIVLRAIRSAADLGASIVHCSHYIPEVEELCSRVIVLHRGTVIAEGPIPQVIASHGEGQVELVVDGKTTTFPGTDLQQAFNSVPDIRSVQSARVINPSLEAVFVHLTGTRFADNEET